MIRPALTLPEADEVVLCPDDDDDDIDCEDRYEIVCPHCGWAHEPTPDYTEDFNASNQATFTCAECKKPFICTVEYSATYTSAKEAGRG